MFRLIACAMAIGVSLFTGVAQGFILVDRFDAGEDSWEYAPNLFNGTERIDLVDGQWSATGGNDGGMLSVQLGPHTDGDPTSAGWGKVFEVPANAVYDISLDYRLFTGGGLDSGEYGEAIVDVDGRRYGGDDNDSLFHQNGSWFSTTDTDTGWVTADLTVPLSAGSHTIIFGAYNNQANSTNEWAEAHFDNVTVSDAPEIVLVAPGAEWQYLDDGTDPGPGWREVDFPAEANWKTGQARLGYGGDGEVTEILFGPNPDNADNDPDNKYTTSYFRHTFDVTDPASLDSLVVRLLRDDGAATYLNGVELHPRTNLEVGAVSDTFASDFVGDAEEDFYFTYEAGAHLLRPGTNVLAVEVHQSSLTSSDVSFDLSLGATPVPEPSALILLGVGALWIVAGIWWRRRESRL